MCEDNLTTRPESVSTETPQPAEIQANGKITVDGVPLGFAVKDNQGHVQLRICDHDRIRSQKRGTRFVVVDVASLVSLDAPSPLPSPPSREISPTTDSQNTPGGDCDGHG